MFKLFTAATIGIVATSTAKNLTRNELQRAADVDDDVQVENLQGEDSYSEDSFSVDSLSDDDLSAADVDDDVQVENLQGEDSLSEDSLSVDSYSDDDLSDFDLDDLDRRLSGKSFKRNDPADHTDDEIEEPEEIEDQDDLAGSLSTHWTGYCIKPYTWNATTSKCDGTSPVNSVRCFRYFTADTSTCQCVFNSDNTYAYDMICLYQFTLNDTC